jgi:neutral ceramidase
MSHNLLSVLLLLLLVYCAGPGAQGFYQSDTSRGFTQWSPLAYLINGVARGKISAQQEKCQGAKPVLLNAGEATIPYPWVPKVTDVSLVRLGNLVSVLGAV